MPKSGSVFDQSNFAMHQFQFLLTGSNYQTKFIKGIRASTCIKAINLFWEGQTRTCDLSMGQYGQGSETRCFYCRGKQISYSKEDQLLQNLSMTSTYISAPGFHLFLPLLFGLFLPLLLGNWLFATHFSALDAEGNCTVLWSWVSLIPDASFWPCWFQASEYI